MNHVINCVPKVRTYCAFKKKKKIEKEKNERKEKQENEEKFSFFWD